MLYCSWVSRQRCSVSMPSAGVGSSHILLWFKKHPGLLSILLHALHIGKRDVLPSHAAKFLRRNLQVFHVVIDRSSLDTGILSCLFYCQVFLFLFLCHTYDSSSLIRRGFIATMIVS